MCPRRREFMYAEASVRNGSRSCENVREPRKRRIVFSIAFFGQPSREFLVFRLATSRRTFYAQNERGSFRTWGNSGSAPNKGHWESAPRNRRGPPYRALQ